MCKHQEKQEAIKTAFYSLLLLSPKPFSVHFVFLQPDYSLKLDYYRGLFPNTLWTPLEVGGYPTWCFGRCHFNGLITNNSGTNNAYQLDGT